MRSAKPAKRTRLRALLAMLAAASIVWGLTRATRDAAEALPLLGTADFGHVPSIAFVEARPPSLYLHLGADAWSKMTDAERREALDVAGKVARNAGYLGIQAWTTDGAIAGQWLVGSGVAIAEKAGRQS